jgi:hypothetical protein
MTSIMRRRALVLAAIVLLVAGVLLVGRAVTSSTQGGQPGLPEAAAPPTTTADVETEAEAQLPYGPREFLESSQGQASGEQPGGEAAEARTAMEQFAEARTAPGIVAPGAYSAAFADLSGLTTAGGAWSDVTKTEYDADDPNYRDYWSNSSGGSGLVTGRITALAADDNGDVYVGGANGGVWRSTSGGGDWTPIADGLPSLSSGDLQIASDGSLWYATGEANTGGTSYAGSGVYRLENPTTGSFSASDRVGGDELESTTINALRFDGQGKVWAATLRGIWWHSSSAADVGTSWTLAYAPNPAYLPADLEAYSTTQTGFGTLVDTQDGANNAAYKNIVNDIAIDPKDPDHLIAAIGWRSGDAYNGFYETRDGGTTWKKVKPTGAINPKDIGNVSFAWAADGSKLYVMNQSPALLNKLTGNVTSYLDGIYVSNNGSIDGPWSQIADTRKLSNSGSALKQAVGGKGYGPGIQSWYNQFLIVDPSDPSHVYAGLEEVYETKNGGSSWSTVGPYWNFYFACWTPDSLYPPNGSVGCPQTTHPDQHSVAIGETGGQAYVYVGNDGGVYRRPLDGTTNRNGNATDWESLNDGTIDALQYYSVSVGNADTTLDRTPDGSGAIVNGGLQDNGGSIYRIGGQKMSSNFGGDGGDTYTDPNNGCNIVGEYVYLTMYVTQTCANTVGNPDALIDPSAATTYTIAPPDINARFIAPFVGNAQNSDQWLAGGNSIWYQDKGFAIRSGSEWQNVYTLDSPYKVFTALAYNGDWAIGGWCGPTCNNSGFGRGVVVLHRVGDTWEPMSTPTPDELTSAGVPNRYIGGVAVDDSGNLYLAMNGFSRRFTEGPGAGFNHIFRSTDNGQTWTALDGTTFPDVPSNSIKVLPSGAIVVGTDLGVLYLPAGGSTWERLGEGDLGSSTAIPVTTVMDVELGPDGYLYAATHGRGIWRIDASGL